MINIYHICSLCGLVVGLVAITALANPSASIGKVELVADSTLFQSQSSIQLTEIISSKERRFNFNFSPRRLWLLKGDQEKLDLRIAGGSLGGYQLELELDDEEYSSKLTYVSCTYHVELKIEEQHIQLTHFSTQPGGLVAGYYTALANYVPKRGAVEKVKINGKFAVNVLDY